MEVGGSKIKCRIQTASSDFGCMLIDSSLRKNQKAIVPIAVNNLKLSIGIMV